MPRRNIRISGATYPTVPAISMKSDSGADVLFVDTSDANATSADIAKNKTAYVNGELITGTREEGGGSCNIGTISVNVTANATNISFTGLQGEPKVFSVLASTQFTDSATRCVVAVAYNGTTTSGCYSYQQSNRTWGINYVSGSYFTFTYTNGTLKITTNSATNGGNFKKDVQYTLTYVY